MNVYIDFYKEENRIELYPQILRYFKPLLGRENEQNQSYIAMQLKEAEHFYSEYEEYIIPKAFVNKIILPSQNEIKRSIISKELLAYLEQYDQNNSKALILAAITCKEVELSDMMGELYLHMWQTASINAVRDYIMIQHNILLKDMNTTEMGMKCSPWFGPGLAELPWNLAKEFGSLLELDKHIQPDGPVIQIKEFGISPDKTFLGGFLLLNQHPNQEDQMNPCKMCQYPRKCEYCMYRKSSQFKE